jgi:hypothetical protein
MAAAVDKLGIKKHRSDWSRLPQILAVQVKTCAALFAADAEDLWKMRCL